MTNSLLFLSRAGLLAAPTLSQSSIVLDWSNAALAAIRTAGTPPPPAARNLAILHAAIHDAVNGVERRYEQYLVQPNLSGSTSAPAAATSAARDVLVALYAAQSATFDALNATILAGITDGAPKTRGIAWGQEVARQILAARANDGSANIGMQAPVGAHADAVVLLLDTGEASLTDVVAAERFDVCVGTTLDGRNTGDVDGAALGLVLRL
jgi:hypothetical protein